MSFATTILTVLATFLFLTFVKTGLAIWSAYVRLGPSSCPKAGFFWTHPNGFLALGLASVFPPRGWLGHYNSRFDLYARKGSTILSGVVSLPASNPRARPIFWIADAEALKIVTSDRQTFVKDLDAYVLVDIYGKSLVTTEGNEWRRHVAVAGPAFCESLNGLAWKETMRLVGEWFDDEVDTGEVEEEDGTRRVNVLSKMTQLTLHVIAAAGFGMRAPWRTFSDMTDDNEHAKDTTTTTTTTKTTILPFHVSLHSTLANLVVRMLTPRSLSASRIRIRIRIPWVTEKLQRAEHAFGSLKKHMEEIVESARNANASRAKHNGNGNGNGNADADADADHGADLLRRLVTANDNDNGNDDHSNHDDTEDQRDLKVAGYKKHVRPLTDDELFSNIFMFLLAGHETSAHTLSFAILLLAVYPDVQTKLREEALRVWPSDEQQQQQDVALSSSSYKSDFDKFEYTLAFFRETLRCFPTEPRLIKLASRDASLPARRFTPSQATSPLSSFDGAETNVTFKPATATVDVDVDADEERTEVFIPEGSMIIMDIWGVHMNPLVWGPDAHLFRPERFIDSKTDAEAEAEGSGYRWPREGFMAFSSGARGCIGQRFALSEAICTLAMLVRRYEVLPSLDSEDPERSQTDGDCSIADKRDFERFKRSMLGYAVALTLTPTTKHVKFRRLRRR